MKLSRISPVLFPFTVYPSQLGGRGLGVGCRCTSKPGRGILSERCGFAAAQCGKACLSVSASKFSEATPQSGRRSLHEFLSRYPVRQSLTALCGGKPQLGSDASLYPSRLLKLRVVLGRAWKADAAGARTLFPAKIGLFSPIRVSQTAPKTRLTIAKTRLTVAKTHLTVAKMRLTAAKMRLTVAKTRLTVAKVQLAIAKVQLEEARTPLAGPRRRLTGTRRRLRIEKSRLICARGRLITSRKLLIYPRIQILYSPTRTATFAKGSHHQETESRPSGRVQIWSYPPGVRNVSRLAPSLTVGFLQSASKTC